MQIPLYQERAAVSTQPVGAQASNVGAAPWAAVAELGGVVSDIGFAGMERNRKLQEQKAEALTRLQNNETEAPVAKYYADRKIRYSEFEKEASTIRDPDELQKFYETWKQSEQQVKSQFKLNAESQRIVSNNDMAFYSDAEVNVNGIAGFQTKARIAQMDDTWITVQELARENQSWTDPETGVELSPSSAFEYATNKRMELGTVGTESGMGDIRNFDQVVGFRQISKIARENPDEARTMLDSSSQSPQNVALLEKTIADAIDQRDKNVITLQSKTSSDFNQKYRSRNLSRTEVDTAMRTTQNVMGKDVPLISESEGSALMAAMNAQEIGERETQFGIFDAVANGWRSVIKASERGKFDQKSFDSAFMAIAAPKSKGSQTPMLSKSTIETQLNFAQENMYKVAEGLGLDQKTSNGLISIIDTMATINDASPYNSRQNIMAINGLIPSYMDAVKDNGGRMSEDQIAEWQKKNMGKQLQESAIIKARNAYRVGEPARPRTTPTGGIILPSAEEGVTNYRYIGGGKFERID